MKIRSAIRGVFVALCLCGATSVHAATEPGKVSLRGHVGIAALSPADINDAARAARDELLADSTVEESRWDPFGITPSLGIELEMQLTRELSFGLAFSSQHSFRRHTAVRVFSTNPATGEPAEMESIEEELRISAWDIGGTLALWVPSAPGLHFGVQLGLVRGALEKEGMHFFETFTAEPFLESTRGDWSGTGVALGAYTGYEQAVTPECALSTRIGYRVRKIGAPDGILRTTRWGDQGNSREWSEGPPLDSDGRPMGLDLGGFYFNLGLSLGFGGGD